MTKTQLQLFLDGQSAFHDVETADDGLGPIFNDTSCGACHANGGGSARISNILGDSGRLEIAAGGPVVQTQSLLGFTPEVVPPNLVVGRRRAMTTLGLGLIGAVSDTDILSMQASQEMHAPWMAGRANIVTDTVTGETGRVGRIGQKSQHPNSTSFAAEAYLREMGITTPFFPHEEAPFNNPDMLTNNPVAGVNDDGEDVLAFGFFMDHLKPPRGPVQSASQKTVARAGAAIFAAIGCAVCHNPTWTTAENGDAALNEVSFSPYSDFLLHDMGASGDQIPQGTNSSGHPIPGSWMRTTPLWGLSTNTVYWHDGSVNTIEAAINKHDGQAADSKAQFNALTPKQQLQLLAFLKSL